MKLESPYFGPELELMTAATFDPPFQRKRGTGYADAGVARESALMCSAAGARS